MGIGSSFSLPGGFCSSLEDRKLIDLETQHSMKIIFLNSALKCRFLIRSSWKQRGYISNFFIYISVYNCSIPQFVRLTKVLLKHLKLRVGPIWVANVVSKLLIEGRFG